MVMIFDEIAHKTNQPIRSCTIRLLPTHILGSFASHEKQSIDFTFTTMLNLLAHRYKRLDLPSRRLDGYKETELVKFCYETEIEDDWKTFEELQGQVFGKFLSANMKSNTTAYQSENDQQQVNQPSNLMLQDHRFNLFLLYCR